jgi:FixJ family two-component response regulator
LVFGLTHIKAKRGLSIMLSLRNRVFFIEPRMAATPRKELTVEVPLIVVIDDDPAVRNSLKFSLELEGFAVRVYRSGAEFLATESLTECKCFVIDQRMPGMSGMEVIAELRGRNVSAPAILIISQPNRVLSTRAAEAHVAIVEKPLLNNALVD